MKKIILVHGMQRSGNHAITQWLAAHDRFIFYNNVIPIAPILAGEAEKPAPIDFASWLRAGRASRLLRPLPFWVIRLARRNHILMASLEDHALTVRPFSNCPIEVTHVLILRDPYNMFASRVRRSSQIDHPTFPKHTGPEMDRVIETWKSHAREYLGLTKVLGESVGIYFNAWFSSENVRRRLSQQLGLAFTDAGYGRVSGVGGGSSFDGAKFDGQNLKMNVLSRQSQLNDSERAVYDQIFEDSELHDLARKVEEAASSRADS